MSANSFLSMCILHCVPVYSFIIPSFPMHVNTNMNSLLTNYPSAGVRIPKGGRAKGQGKGKLKYRHDRLATDLLVPIVITEQ